MRRFSSAIARRYGWLFGVGLTLLVVPAAFSAERMVIAEHFTAVG